MNRRPRSFLRILDLAPSSRRAFQISMWQGTIWISAWNGNETVATNRRIPPGFAASFGDALVALDRLHREASDYLGEDDAWVDQLETLWWQLNRHMHDLEPEIGPAAVETILSRFCEGHCRHQDKCRYKNTCPVPADR